MAVIAIFKYQIKPGRLPDFMRKLAEAADPKFDSPTMPKSVRLFRSTVPGPDTELILMLEYEDMAAYGARTAFETANAEWQRLFEPARNAPEIAGLGGTADGSAAGRGRGRCERAGAVRVPAGVRIAVCERLRAPRRRRKRALARAVAL